MLYLKGLNAVITEKAHTIKIIRSGVSKTLNEEAEINHLVAGNMYKAGVDALANAIQNDPRFLAMIVASALNENLAK